MFFKSFFSFWIEDYFRSLFLSQGIIKHFCEIFLKVFGRHDILWQLTFGQTYTQSENKSIIRKQLVLSGKSNLAVHENKSRSCGMLTLQDKFQVELFFTCCCSAKCL